MSTTVEGQLWMLVYQKLSPRGAVVGEVGYRFQGSREEAEKALPLVGASHPEYTCRHVAVHPLARCNGRGERHGD